jgi:hypothetical protein
VVAGPRAYLVGTQNGGWPALGFHTRGEMGGIWSPPLKLLDGIWFGVQKTSGGTCGWARLSASPVRTVT